MWKRFTLKQWIEAPTTTADSRLYTSFIRRAKCIYLSLTLYKMKQLGRGKVLYQPQRLWKRKLFNASRRQPCHAFEVSLYWKCFFSSPLSKRDPHLYRTVTNKGDVRINRNKNLEWSRYDPNYKKYLSIGKSPAACSCDVMCRIGIKKKNREKFSHHILCIVSINDNGMTVDFSVMPFLLWVALN